MSREQEQARDAELARTATAPASSRTIPSAPSEMIGATLGRYRIEGVLGAGGMGVVYTAFDPDLERRVALKVLAQGTADTAEQRLLREARAMARLTHGNVVAVYEVGTASGRDFIAMEKIDGEPLVDWLRAEQRGEAAIVDAFVQAGRGLAAAHAAGVIHRDFKPHNVLRSRDGRVAVTDFGLAREATDPLAITAPIDAHAAGTSSLSGLTVPGALLGTPAYMAPEQWRGERVTQATDQFAYCVALWEALAGKRPYDGTTVDALRDRILAGPDALDDAAIPRRLRTVLRRGLAPDPAERWPSMTALLARIERAERRSGVAIAIVVGALAIAAALVFALRGADAPVVEACPAPALDPSVDTARAAPVDPKRWGSVGLLHAAAAAWHRERARVCALAPAARAAPLACLDRLATRIEMVRRASQLASSDAEHVRTLLVAPELCAAADPPKLPRAYSEHAVVALAALGGKDVPADRVEAARAQAATDPCVRAYLALRTAPTSTRDAEDARNAASLCGDESAYALASIATLRTRFAAVLAPDVQQRLADAERAIERVGNPELRFELHVMKASIAFVNQDTDKALALLDEASPLAPDAHALLQLGLARATWLVNRARPEDLVRVRNEAFAARIATRAVLGSEALAPRFELADATAQWKQGDVAGAHPRLLALLAEVPPPAAENPVTITGTVVDAKGAPVAGATVAGGPAMAGDSIGIVTPMIDPADNLMRQVEIVKTDAKGAFTLTRVPAKGLAVAAHGALRSRPVGFSGKPLRLVVGPTTKVSGRVELRGPRNADLVVAVMWAIDVPYWVQMPVRADGTFEIEGIPAGATKIGVWRSAGALTGSSTLRPIRVGTQPITGIVLDPATRPLRVLLRSTTNVPLSGGLVFVTAGTTRPKTIADLAAFETTNSIALQTPVSVLGEPPKEIAGVFRANDLVATFDGAPSGAGTVCAFGFQGDLADKAYLDRIRAAMHKHPESFQLHCAALTADATALVMDVPPMRRLD